MVCSKVHILLVLLVYPREFQTKRKKHDSLNLQTLGKMLTFERFFLIFRKKFCFTRPNYNKHVTFINLKTSTRDNE